MNSFKILLLAGSTLLSSAALAQTAPNAPRYGSFGIDLGTKDTTVKPGDDFWAYANGGWDKRTDFAADRAAIGYGSTLGDEAEVNVRAILDDIARNPGAYSPAGQSAGALFASWMDEAGIEARGTAPLKPYLARIAAVQDLAGLQMLFSTPGYASPVDLDIIPDFADPTHYTAIASQSGLGMARDNYLLEGEKYDGYRKAYRAYVQHIQELAGIPDAAAKADAIMALETALAKVHWSPVQNRDIAAINKPMDHAGMEKLAPEFDWELMLKTTGLQNMPTVIMANDTALTATGKILVATPLQTWKDWMTYRFISGHATTLPRAFDDASFDFFSRTLNGVQVKRDRWKRGIQLVNGAMGEAVGELYVARHFPAESAARMAELIADLRGALEERLNANPWMDEATRKAALVKLSMFEPRIGHPVKYIDYSKLQMQRGDLLGNTMRSGEFNWQLQLSRLGKPVDRSLWSITPQTVDAYYSSLSNQITFPAAILQPPYFDPKADAAVNYGAIGAIIGHEIGHGFDDNGSQFDGTGKFTNWWSDASKAAFKERQKALGAQYDSYEPVPGTHIQGGLTMGENIGDLGGVEMAYAAYQRYQAKHGKAPVIDGLTGDQRFFLSYAQAWQAKRREGLARQLLLTDPHSPPKYRVNGVVRNIDAWYKAFNIQPSDALYLAPEQRVHIW